MTKTLINKAEPLTHKYNILQTHVNKYDATTIASERTPDEYVLAFNEPITNNKNNTDTTSIVNEKILDE